MKKNITQKAQEKYVSCDPSFDTAVEYVLLYPDFREVKLIPGKTQHFILKDAIGKDYKRLTFYLISAEELFYNSDYSHGEFSKNVSNISDIHRYSFSPASFT